MGEDPSLDAHGRRRHRHQLHAFALADASDEAGSRTRLERRSVVTRLGVGVDADGSLSDEAMARVFSTLEEYRELIDRHRADARSRS